MLLVPLLAIAVCLIWAFDGGTKKRIAIFWRGYLLFQVFSGLGAESVFERVRTQTVSENGYFVGLFAEKESIKTHMLIRSDIPNN